MVEFVAKIRAVSVGGSSVVTVPRQYLKDGSFVVGDLVRINIKKEGDFDVEAE